MFVRTLFLLHLSTIVDAVFTVASPNEMTVVYLGLGSNLGTRRQHLQQAVSALSAIGGISDLRLSEIIETAPVGGPQQGDYLNAVVELECQFSAFELLEHIQRIEHQGNRQRSGKNHPRTIDIDILLFGDEQHALPELTIPHPRMLQRAFVLEPLSEFLPEYSNHAAANI